MARVLVVGSGVAGLSVALRAAELGHAVTVVTKGAASDSATSWAQGGIAAALGPEDSPALHASDTLRAGAGLGNADAVAALCAEGPARVRELAALGARFDRDSGGRFALGREAAHSRARIVHAQGDATGLAVETALLGAALRHAAEVGRIELVEHEMLLDLVVDGGAVRGIRSMALGRPSEAGSRGSAPRERRADVVVLATGGAGQLYRHSTNPAVATGDGIAAALRAGAAVRDLEFVQFHPTALAAPGTPLISEAVRGEGAVLRDETGRRFLVGRHPDAELAPRDVVARAIAAAMRCQGGRPVHLDATRVPALVERFPGLTRMLADRGVDWSRDPVPVTPAAHYLMGGIRTDLYGRTSLRGLFAVGECASTGVHGANRLASNSLLEGLVFGRRVAGAIGSDDPAEVPSGATHLGGPGSPAARDRSGATPDIDRGTLTELMWDHVGLERDAAGLRAALARLDAGGLDVAGVDADGVDADGVHAAGVATASDPVASPELRNLLLLARVTTEAALARKHSVGAHFRRDDPGRVAAKTPEKRLVDDAHRVVA